MTLYDKINRIAAIKGQSPWAERIGAELQFAADLSCARAHAYDALAERAADVLLAALERDGAITRNAVLEAEEILMPLSSEAKSYRVHCIGHAHIDMNWMWGFQETASVAVDTFRTMLDLMEEYPDFTFAQSQASTYKIVEEFAPEMIEEIKQRVHEGRWEVSASTWVELDKNMPNGESMARHLLYTKRYLSRLLDIPADSLQLDFEPDTFGHNISVPEICAKGGVKYYYHCRANEDHEFAYVWRARSGAELLVYCDPFFYNGQPQADRFCHVPQWCGRYGIKDYLYVYGVGDHGGGPTRRDINRLIDMNTWPIMPTMQFSTYGKFFAALEQSRDRLPVREGEINYVFTGCYTSQSRIKMANRIAEDRMEESEFLGAAAHLLADGPRYNQSYAKAWEQILFNHFHDILPGSGVIDTREYAMGQFQRAMAAIDTNANRAMRTLAAAIDTTALLPDEPTGENECGQGAGVGFRVDQGSHYGLPQAGRAVGKKRAFHFFNPTRYDFDGVSTLTVWDWQYDVSRAVLTDAAGHAADIRHLAAGQHFWGHEFHDFAVRVKVPALGYATYLLDEVPITDRPEEPVCIDRADEYSDAPVVLENDRLRAVFDHATMQVVSLVDKETGRETVSAPAGSFLLIHENTVHGMTSWRVGDRMTAENLNTQRDVRVLETATDGIRRRIRYDLGFGERSRLTVTVTLDDNSPRLDYDIVCDFQEVGNGSRLPQLYFEFPVAYAVANYRYDVPFGTIDRPAVEHDVPANSYAVALPAEAGASAIQLVTDSKYGFRGARNAVGVDLIRGSTEPDPYPEFGMHHIRLGVAVTADTAPGTLDRMAAFFVHPLAACTARRGAGSLPPTGQLVAVAGDVRLSAVKLAEDGDGLIVRVSDQMGAGAAYTLTAAMPVTAACVTDLCENEGEALPVSGRTVSGTVPPYAVQTVKITF